MAIDVKICGLRTKEAVKAAVDGGAAYVGFVFFPASPRHVVPESAAELAALVPADVTKVGLVVDADDAALAAILAACPLDLWQLHGTETPERASRIRERFGLPVMKAVSVSGPEDVARAHTYEPEVDRLLFDAKAPSGATRPGGNAVSFDWDLLSGSTWSLPWLLAGGLDAGNLAQAVGASGARAVDVSSGVEDAPGLKSPEKIAEFLKIAASL